MRKFRRAGAFIALAVAAIALGIMTETKGTANNAATDLENRLRTVLAGVAGVGQVELLVNESSAGEIVGVCVLTDAADDIAAVFNIQRAVRTTLGIDNDKIEVIGMEDGK